ncbi:MAG: MFS transporter [Coriobacteriales bacterium]|nr:MFS transporter [Coriobacteriales bacterium]
MEPGELASAGLSDNAPNGAKRPLWTKNFVFACLAQLGNAFSFYLVMTVISKFAVGNLHTDTGLAGVIASMFIIGAILSRAFTAMMMGFWGYKRTLIVGVVIALVSSAAYLVSFNIQLLIIVRLTHGFGFGVITSAAPTIAASAIPHERAGEGMGYYSLGPTFATGLGPFIGMLLSGANDYNIIFVISIAIMLVSLFFAMGLKLKPRHISQEEKRNLRGFHIKNIIEPPAAPASTIALIMYVCFGAIISFLALFVQEINLVQFSSVFFIVYALTVFVSRPFVGKFFDKHGGKLIIYLALAVLTVGFVVFSQMSNPVMLIVSAIIIGLGVGTTQAATLAEVTRITPPERSGVANTTYYLFSDIGYSGGPIIIGFLIPFLGYRGMYLAMAGVTVVNMLFFTWYLHSQKRKASKQ